MNVSLPHDSRFAETLRLLVAHAARFAGSPESDAEAFSRTVEKAVREAWGAHGSGRSREDELDVVVRRSSGPIEVRIGAQTLTLDP
jgi:hypothetical protein